MPAKLSGIMHRLSTIHPATYSGILIESRVFDLENWLLWGIAPLGGITNMR